MLSRDAIIGNLIYNKIYFNRPILTEDNGIIHSPDLYNFIEIYSILARSLGINNYHKKSLKASILLKKNSHIFWELEKEKQFNQQYIINQRINNLFSIRKEYLDQLVDLVIMPTFI